MKYYEYFSIQITYAIAWIMREKKFQLVRYFHNYFMISDRWSFYLLKQFYRSLNFKSSNLSYFLMCKKMATEIFYTKVKKCVTLYNSSTELFKFTLKVKLIAYELSHVWDD